MHRPSASVAGGGGEYACAAAYPTPAASLAYGRQNLHLFRFKNTRFDLIGGAFYFLLVVSVLPRCDRLAAVLDAHTVGGLSHAASGWTGSGVSFTAVPANTHSLWVSEWGCWVPRLHCWLSYLVYK